MRLERLWNGASESLRAHKPARHRLAAMQRGVKGLEFVCEVSHETGWPAKRGLIVSASCSVTQSGPTCFELLGIVAKNVCK